ncbi:MAG: hypothetical protein M3P30_07525 [Chloroflexota bacterium]|nr:hypothetical protein [Chloroflexota bacterium]
MVAPLVLSVAATAIIDATYGNVGAAAVPFVLAAYVLGLALWALMRTVLPRQLCFLIAVAATAVCLAGVFAGSNLLSWLLISAIGGLLVTVPVDRRDGHGRAAGA